MLRVSSRVDQSPDGGAGVGIGEERSPLRVVGEGPHEGARGGRLRRCPSRVRRSSGGEGPGDKRVGTAGLYLEAPSGGVVLDSLRVELGA